MVLILFGKNCALRDIDKINVAHLEINDNKLKNNGIFNNFYNQ